MGSFSINNIFSDVAIRGMAESLLPPLILNMTITSSMVIMFVLFARLILKNAPKVFSYALWAVVLFRLLCPVSFATEFSMLGLINAPAVVNSQHTTAVEFIPYDVVHTQELKVQLPVPDVVNEAVNKMLPQEHAALGADPLEGDFAIGSLLWELGIMVMAVYSLVSYVLLRRKLIGALLLDKNIYLADGITTPFVMGLIYPKIYLPSMLADREQKYIILHEQHHIRRGDHIIKVLAFFALCFHWFNPLVWMAFILASKDMEMSCDEAVMKKLGEDIRTDYSASLLSLATGRYMISGAPLAFGEGDTRSRIKNILSWKKPKIWITIVAAVIFVVVVSACAGNPPVQVSGQDVSDDVEKTVSDNAEEAISDDVRESVSDDMEETISAETMILVGDWILDGVYLENANSSLLLRSVFGEDFDGKDAFLQVNADGNIAFSIGKMTGNGTWYEDGDTGRYAAEVVVEPYERNEMLIFYEFRENPDSRTELVLEYEGYAIYWMRKTD